MPEGSPGTCPRPAVNCMGNGKSEHPGKIFQQIFLSLIPQTKEDPGVLSPISCTQEGILSQARKLTEHHTHKKLGLLR